MTITEHDVEPDSIWDRLFHETHATLKKIEHKADVLLAQAGQEWSTGNNFQLSAAGLINSFVIFDNAEGYKTKITRILLWADGFTPASGYSNVAGWGGIFYNQVQPQNLIDFFPAAPGGVMFPGLAEFSGDSAPVLRMNDRIVCQVTNGPANGNITVILWGKKSREIK